MSDPLDVTMSDAEWEQFVAWRGGPVVILGPDGRPRMVVSNKELLYFRTSRLACAKGRTAVLKEAIERALRCPPGESPAEGPAAKPTANAVHVRCRECQGWCFFTKEWATHHAFDGLCEHCQKKRLDADLAAAEAVARGPACHKCGRRVVVFCERQPYSGVVCWDCVLLDEKAAAAGHGLTTGEQVSFPAPTAKPPDVPEHDRKLVCTVCGETAYLSGAPLSDPETFVCFACCARSQHWPPETSPQPPANEEPPRKINFREFLP